MQSILSIVMKIGLVISLSLSSISYATVQPIKQGDPAPYDGFVFDHESEQIASNYRADAEFYKNITEKLYEKIDLQDKNSEILEKRLQLYINESNVLIKDRAQAETTERLYLLGAFALGVVATGLIVRNVRP